MAASLTRRAFTTRELWILRVVSIALVVGTAALVLRLGLNDAGERLQARIDVAHELLTQHIANSFGALSSLAGVYQASDALDPSEFTSLTQQVLERHHYISSIIYVSFIPHEEREEFEVDMRSAGNVDFNISRVKTGEISPPNESYLPVTFIEPMTPYSARMLGADLREDSTTEGVLRDAVRTGKIAAAESSLFSTGMAALTLIQPTYYGTFVPETAGERMDQLSGAYVLAIALPELLSQIGEGDRLSLDVVGASAPPPPATKLGETQLSAERKLRFGGKELELHLRDTVGLEQLPWHWAALAALVVAALSAAVVTALRHRRRALLEIQRSNDMFFDLVDGSVQGIFIHRNWEILFANQTFCDILGYKTPTELLRVPQLLYHIAPEERARLRDYSNTRQEGSAPVRYEFKAIREDGSEIVLENSVRVVQWHGSDAIQCTVTDITERKAAELSLIEVSERALSAARAKSEFLANMSHELRTPLNGVCGMLQMLSVSPLDEEQNEYVSVASASSDALLSLIDDILDFSRLESGRLELQHEHIDIRNWLQTVGEKLADGAQSKGVEFATRIATDTPRQVVADPKRLQQVVANLVGNACKFTDVGAILLDIKPIGPPDNAVVDLEITVADTGIGIAKGDYDKIFESFTQADGSTTRRFGGTGLGLAIARQLVERMGGTLDLDSIPGSGSIFTVRVPFEVVRQSEPLPPMLAGQIVGCIEPSPIQRQILVEYLEALGAKVIPFEVFPTDPLSLIACRYLVCEATILLRHQAVIFEMQKRRTLDVICLSTPARYRTDAEAIRHFARATISKPIALGSLIDAFSLTGPTLARPEELSARVLYVDDNPLSQRIRGSMLNHLGFKADVSSEVDDVLQRLDERRYALVLLDCETACETAEAVTRAVREMAPEIPIVGLAARSGGCRPVEAELDGCIPTLHDSRTLRNAITQSLSLAA